MSNVHRKGFSVSSLSIQRSLSVHCSSQPERRYHLLTKKLCKYHHNHYPKLSLCKLKNSSLETSSLSPPAPLMTVSRGRVHLNIFELSRRRELIYTVYTRLSCSKVVVMDNFNSGIFCFADVSSIALFWKVSLVHRCSCMIHTAFQTEN